MSAPAPADKKKKVSKPAEHPKYKDMIRAAIESLKERNGSSRQAISKYLKANYKVGDSVDVHLKTELKRLIASGDIVHTKGTGASGSFKVAKTAEKPKKKPAAKKKTPTKKKAAAKKKPAKKPAASKKPAVKKAAKKPASKKKPAAKKAAKKAPKKKPASKKPKK